MLPFQRKNPGRAVLFSVQYCTERAIRYCTALYIDVSLLLMYCFLPAWKNWNELVVQCFSLYYQLMSPCTGVGNGVVQ